MTSSDPFSNAQKTRGRPFGKGNTAGRGRPAGSRDAATQLLDTIGSEAPPDVLRAAVEAARGGDVQAMKIILDRVWPPRSGRPLHVRRLAHPLSRGETHAGVAIGRRGLNGRYPAPVASRDVHSRQ